MSKTHEYSRLPHHGVASILLALAVTAAGCKGAHDTPSTNPTPSPHEEATAVVDAAPAANAVQSEMLLLTEAMRDSVTAIGYGHLGEIPAAVERVHHAKEATEQALESGNYKLRKNGADMKGFQELDEAFHGELEKLVEKAKTNDAVATSTQLGVVLSKCDGCHSRFRP
ncbi:MAG: cytochrome c [Polyangiaceae bacterium]